MYLDAAGIELSYEKTAAFMRQSLAAVALIRRSDAGQTRYLAQWNPHWHAYNFISGHKGKTETFRECMIREVGEELNLSREVEFCVADEPLTYSKFNAWSQSAKAQTFYTMELFEVRLVSESALQKVNADSRNRWLTEQEILNGKCEDGRPVSETMKRLIAKTGVC